MFRKVTCLFCFLLLLSVANDVANADISDGLLVWHDFDDLLDDSGNGHDAVLGGSAYIADGLLYLQGDGGYADIGAATFGPVNPMVDAQSDFTIAIAYASTQGDFGMLLSVGPIATAEQSGDFSLFTNDDGQSIDHWWVNGFESDQSGVGYADGTVHLVIVTYVAATDTYTFYHLDGGAAVTHGGEEGSDDWSGNWDENLDYTPRIGTSANANVVTDSGPGGDGDWAYLDGQVDMVAIWDRALDTSEMPEIAEHTPRPVENAANLSPPDKATNVPLDAVLSWTPGIYADKHDVYFGTNFNDVNDATAAVDPNNVYQGRQSTAGYPVPEILDYGQTYYWRIDEVNAPPDNTIYKGDVWSFTAEPFAYSIDADNMIVTASSYQEGSEPDNTVNGSGLDDDLHSTAETDMWLSAEGGPQPTWIQYEFNKAYKLHQMWVWNHNTLFEPYLGFGFRNVTIEYSTDGTHWTQLSGVPEFNQAPAPASSNYAHNTTIDFDGLVARYVRLTANSNWKGLPQSGLSEVRLLYTPLRAREPNPADEQEDVAPDAVLSWRAGRETATHEVYIGTDEQAVTEGTVVPVTRTEATYDPLSLDLDETYYWKVAEVNNTEEPNVWESEVWSFTTSDSLVVDDMESYGDAAVPGQPGSNIWYTWKDGEGWSAPEPSYGGNGTGSIVEIGTDPAIDRQSLTCYYDNDGTNSLGTSGKQYYSEVTAAIADLPVGADWTQAGIRALSLQFYGDPDNDAGATEQMYVKLNGVRIPYDGDMSDIQEEWWHVWMIDLVSFGISLQNVTQISVGFGSGSNTPTPGGSGVVYLDDVRLYPSRCVAEHGPVGDITADCLVDNEDFAALAKSWHMPNLAVEYTFTTGLSDTSGNNRHAISQNNPVVSGGVLTLDGTNFVDIPLGANNPFDGSQDFSILMDFRSKVPSILISSAKEPFEPMGDGEPGTYSATHAMSVFVHRWDEPYWGEVIYDNFYVGDAAAEDDPLDGEWHTMVVTYDADGGWNDELEQPTGLATVYLDGVSGGGTDIDPNIPDVAADTVRIGGSLNAEFPYSEDAGNFSGDIDNVRIYNFALPQEDVRSLPAVPFGPADLNMDGIVDFEDFAILASNWLGEQLWP